MSISPNVPLGAGERCRIAAGTGCGSAQMIAGVSSPADQQESYRLIDYPAGDMWTPQIDRTEALARRRHCAKES